MAPKSKKSRRPAPVAKKARARRPARTRKNIGSSPIWRVLRPLVGLLPASSFLTGLGDFFFAPNSIATATTTTDASGLTKSAESRVVGVSVCLCPTPASLLSRHPALVRETVATAGPCFWTTYRAARLISMSIKMSLNSAAAKRAGDYGMAYMPFRDSDDWTHYKSAGHHMDFRTLTSIEGSVRGPVSRALTLSFRPRPTDGLAYGFTPLDQPIGILCISFENANRDAYNELMPSDFSVDISVACSFQLRSQELSFNTQFEYSEKPQYLTMVGADNTPRRIAHYVRDGKKCLSLVKSDDYKCVPSSTNSFCSVTGYAGEWTDGILKRYHGEHKTLHDKAFDALVMP